MSIHNKIQTPEAFWDFVNDPDNDGRFFELIRGEIVEVMPSNPYSSAIAARIVYYLMQYIMQNPIGHVTTENAGYILTDDTTIAPDVAFIAKSRQPTLPTRGFNPIPPDLAVEVISPSDLESPQRRIQDKIAVYQAVEIPLLWLVYPEQQSVAVYVNGQLTQTLDTEGVLEGHDILPGFKLAVKAIFAG